jgi:drug/metabolite transporter (DMT)-like permease
VVSHAGANRVFIYQYLAALIGVVAGILLLGEGFNIQRMIGAAMILFGVYLARWH